MLTNDKYLKKTKIFLGLVKKYKTLDKITPITTDIDNLKINFNIFNKIYTSLLNIIYIVDWFHNNKINPTTHTLFYFYSKLSKQTKYTSKLIPNLLQTYITNNFIVFCKPTKQLFCIFFKNKPVFIFTGGLMRFILNETRKSSKKLYKVAMSLIKLALILSNNKKYFNTFYIKLNNIGYLRNNVLRTFNNPNIIKMITYIITNIKQDVTSQKFKTRRSIKKYVKKRFKLNT